MKAETPMLQQYFRAKAEHPGTLMAMRVGDFYEFYGEDAETAAKALEITLTGREDGGNGRVPMAGVPYHSVEKYIARLVQQGHRVALCDQVEDPKKAKGLVRRSVTRVVTPGTVLEDSMLSAERNNFLAAICVSDGVAGLATLDPSTGEFLVTEIVGDDWKARLLQELARIRPAELLLPKDADEAIADPAAEGLGVPTSSQAAMSPPQAERRLLGQFSASSLAGYGCAEMKRAIVAASMVLGYAEQNGLSLGHVDSLATYSVDDFMRLDASTRRSLELTQNLADGSRRFTLLSQLDATVSAMGSRLMRRWVDQPLLDVASIRSRHAAVRTLVENALPRYDLRDALKRVADIERLVARCATGLAMPRDLAALRNTLRALPEMADPLRKMGVGRIQELREKIGDHADLGLLLTRSLVPDPPQLVRDGGVIAEGYDAELDKLRDLSRNGKTYIAKLEAQERERTGIAHLRVGFNSVFGYYLEVRKGDASRVPDSYIRKQTTANAERYITAELKEHESVVLGAEEKALALEAELFRALLSRVADGSAPLIQTARAIAELDVLAGLAESAVRNRYIEPELVEEDRLEYSQGRHAVVEANVNTFVPNDLSLNDAARLMVLTGPNMSGKSTYLRQTALIALMAQIGSFVPAASCRLGLCDRIFARIGAKDEIALGQSTFMVEMVESANILNHATSRSLVILDEVGRGTSTWDGLAIAWAMVEELARIGCKTMFATHYHQLNDLATQLPNVRNFRVAVEEIGDQVVWTHRVLPGGTDKSYGIHVARMAGVPPRVLQRAGEVLADLHATQAPPRPVAPGLQNLQLTLFEAEESPVVRELRGLDVNQLTPIEALQLLDSWRKRL